MTLIPTHDSLRAESWIRNEDSAFVFPGQHVQVKVAAYPFQKYGMLHGTVLSVSPDSAEANNSSSLPAPALSTAPLPNNSEPPQYKVVVSLDTQQLTRDGRAFPVKAGMQLTAEINQGHRTIMEYLLSPVRKVAFEAARER
jgi:HlyD family secretion protein